MSTREEDCNQGSQVQEGAVVGAHSQLSVASTQPTFCGLCECPLNDSTTALKIPKKKEVRMSNNKPCTKLNFQKGIIVGYRGSDAIIISPNLRRVVAIYGTSPGNAKFYTIGSTVSFTPHPYDVSCNTTTSLLIVLNM